MNRDNLAPIYLNIASPYTTKKILPQKFRKVSLINPPFANRNYPSLALGLLKSCLVQHGHQVNVYYANLLYAELIGVDAYDTLSIGHCEQKGEQVFTQLLHPDREKDFEFAEYIRQSLPLNEFMALVKHAENFLDTIAKQVLVGKPDIIGITSTLLQRQAALALAKKIRQLDATVDIVMGGADCETPMGEELLRNYPFLDDVFHGDAEVSFVEYVNHFDETKETRSDVNGISFRTKVSQEIVTRPRASPTILDNIPVPDYTDFIIETRLFGQVSDTWQLPYETSRGCWWGEKHHCTFCGLNGQQIKYRLKSTEIIKEQLVILRSRHGPRQVVFTDNIISYDSVRTILPEIGKIDGFRYFFETKANLKKSDLEIFKTNFVTAIQPGIERLNTQALKLMNKGVSAKQNIYLLKFADEFNIEILWNYIYGFPREDSDSLTDEIKLIKKLRSLPPPYSHSRVRVDRYSPLFDEGTKHGIVVGAPTGRDKWLPFPLDSRTRMAYFFDFSYTGEDELENNSLWEQLASEIDMWKKQYRPKSLTYSVKGSSVIILDNRPMMEAREIKISGRLAEVFLKCKEGLHVRECGAIQEELEILFECEVAVKIDNHIISLPILVNR